MHSLRASYLGAFMGTGVGGGGGRFATESLLSGYSVHQCHDHNTVFSLPDGLQVQTLIFLVELAIRLKRVGIHPGRVKCRWNCILQARERNLQFSSLPQTSSKSCLDIQIYQDYYNRLAIIGDKFDFFDFFFQASSFQLLKLENSLRWSFFTFKFIIVERTK